MTFKEQLKPLLLRFGLLRVRQALLPRSVAILAYHSVSTDRSGQAYCLSPGITTEAERFRDQMRLLRREYHPVTLDDVVAWLRGDATLPPRAVAVTFDDGYADNYEVAAPIMEEFDLRGAIYLTVDSVRRRELPWFCRLAFLFRGPRANEQNPTIRDPESGRIWKLDDPKENRDAFLYLNERCAARSDGELRHYIEELETMRGVRLDPATAPKMMTFEQARELRRRGHLVGNHTFSHGNVAHVPPDALHRELVEAHEILSRELGEPVEHFSYPHPCLEPQWNDRTLALTERLGYRSAVLTRHGIVTRQCPPLLLPRVAVENQDAEAFRWRLETAFAKIGG